jgi:hypothetical protein
VSFPPASPLYNQTHLSKQAVLLYQKRYGSAVWLLWHFNMCVAVETPIERKKQPVDSRDWSKKYEVLSISRFYLHHSLGFSAEAVESLTDEDMQWIADVLIAHYLDHEFDEEVKFVTLHALEQEPGGNHAEGEEHNAF